MKYLSLTEIQMEEKNILEETIKFLNKNNIKYSVCGGTMLGAVRHKGFIPWDDDIDIFIPRDDYQKLISLLEKNSCKLHSYRAISVLLKNSYCPFIKIVNEKILTNNERMASSKQLPLWIDIFPIDGMPENEYDTKKLYAKIAKYRNLYMLKGYNYKYVLKSTTAIKVMPKLILKAILQLIPHRLISRKMDTIAKTFSYSTATYVGGVLWGYGPQERLLKKDVLWKDFDFEDLKVKGLANYDTYLSNIYGDYMTLPPEEKRATHEFKAWRKDDER